MLCDHPTTASHGYFMTIRVHLPETIYVCHYSVCGNTTRMLRKAFPKHQCGGHKDEGCYGIDGACRESFV